ncbi:hypothetical protein D3C71_654130 [compost metagenome]
MYQEILALFSSDGAVATAIGVLVAVTIKSVSMLNQIMDFRDKHFVEKRYKLLKELSTGIPTDSKLVRYLGDSIEHEAFRIVSGIRGSSLKISALIKLDSLGFWNREQIRRAAKFLVVTPGHPEPSIKITRADIFGARFGLAVAVFLLLTGGVISIALTLKFPLFGFFIGLGVLTVMIWAGAFFASDYHAYKGALDVHKYLIDHPETFSTKQTGSNDQAEAAVSVEVSAVA